MKRYRHILTTLLLTLGALLALPRRAYAGTCSDLIPDPGACIDQAQYSLFSFLAAAGWQIDRMLLLAAYMVNRIRWFLVDSVFLLGYRAMEAVVGPLLAPLIGLALSGALLAIVAIPVLGRKVFGDLRQIVVLAVMLPWALTNLGPAVVQFELVRSDLATSTFADLRANAPASVFGGKDGTTDIASVQPLYPVTCGSTTLQRGGSSGPRLADSVAALLWATGKDIHCPTLNATNDQPQLPDAWTKPEQADYAYGGSLGDVEDAGVRQKYISRIQQGAVRAFLAIPSAAMANLEELMHLIFALAMMVIWIGAPLVLVGSLFQSTFAGIATLIRGTVEVVQMSLLVSFVLQVITLFLDGAARLGSAVGFIGISTVSSVLLLGLSIMAFVTLWRATKTVSDSFAESVGGAAVVVQESGQRMGQMAQTAGSAALTLAGGVAGAGLAAAGAGAAAAAQGANGAYATGQALASHPLLAQAGALAAMMGLLPEEAEQGLATGSRTRPLLMEGVRARRADMTRYAATGSSTPQSERRDTLDYAREAAQIEDGRTAFQHRERLTPQDYQAENRRLRERRMAYAHRRERTPDDYARQNQMEEDSAERYAVDQATVPERQVMEAAKAVATRAQQHAKDVAADPTSTPAERQAAQEAAEVAVTIAQDKTRAYEDARMAAIPGQTDRVRAAVQDVVDAVHPAPADRATTVPDVTQTAAAAPQLTQRVARLPGDAPPPTDRVRADGPLPQLPGAGGAGMVLERDADAPPTGAAAPVIVPVSPSGGGSAVVWTGSGTLGQQEQKEDDHD